MTMATRLRTLRKAHELTVRELGKKAQLHYSVVSRLERGERASVSLPAARRLAKALGVTVGYLLDAEEEGTHESPLG